MTHYDNNWKPIDKVVTATIKLLWGPDTSAIRKLHNMAGAMFKPVYHGHPINRVTYEEYIWR